MTRHHARVAGRAGHRCEYRHAPEANFNLPFEVEHIVPTSRGGPDDESNLALACRACNLDKSDQRSGVDATTREEVPSTIRVAIAGTNTSLSIPKTARSKA